MRRIARGITQNGAVFSITGTTLARQRPLFDHNGIFTVPPTLELRAPMPLADDAARRLARQRPLRGLGVLLRGPGDQRTLRNKRPLGDERRLHT